MQSSLPDVHLAVADGRIMNLTGQSPPGRKARAILIAVIVAGLLLLFLSYLIADHGTDTNQDNS